MNHASAIDTFYVYAVHFCYSSLMRVICWHWSYIYVENATDFRNSHVYIELEDINTMFLQLCWESAFLLSNKNNRMHVSQARSCQFGEIL